MTRMYIFVYMYIHIDRYALLGLRRVVVAVYFPAPYCSLWYRIYHMVICICICMYYMYICICTYIQHICVERYAVLGLGSAHRVAALPALALHHTAHHGIEYVT